jgi:hypothetical protein
VGVSKWRDGEGWCLATLEHRKMYGDDARTVRVDGEAVRQFTLPTKHSLASNARKCDVSDVPQDEKPLEEDGSWCPHCSLHWRWR